MRFYSLIVVLFFLAEMIIGQEFVKLEFHHDSSCGSLVQSYYVAMNACTMTFVNDFVEYPLGFKRGVGGIVMVSLFSEYDKCYPFGDMAGSDEAKTVSECYQAYEFTPNSDLWVKYSFIPNINDADFYTDMTYGESLKILNFRDSGCTYPTLIGDDRPSVSVISTGTVDEFPFGGNLKELLDNQIKSACGDSGRVVFSRSNVFSPTGEDYIDILYSTCMQFYPSLWKLGFNEFFPIHFTSECYPTEYLPPAEPDTTIYDDPNVKKYMMANYYWTDNCIGEPFKSESVPMFGVCDEKTNQKMYLGEDEKTITIYYYDEPGCVGVLSTSEELLQEGDCLPDPEGKGIGRTFKAEADPIERSSVSSFQLSGGQSCEEFTNSDEADEVKQKRDVKITYFAEGICMGGEEFDDYSPEGTSLTGECEDGQLCLKNYTLTDRCDNVYEIYENSDVCFQSRSNPEVYYYFTCISAYCYSVVEYDTKNVCSGHGDCIGTDNCECDENYSGDDCSVRKSWWMRHLSAVIAVTASSFIICCLSFLACISCLLILCCCILSLPAFFLCSGSLSSVIFFQGRRLSKFGELDDFYILLEQQKVMKDSNLPHFSIHSETMEIDPNDITLLSVIGEGGSNSTVYKCKWQNKEVAFKAFRTRMFCSTKEDFSEFERESNLLASLSHPNVVQFFGCCLKPPRIGFVMEYCENGDLGAYIKKNRGSIAFEIKCRFLKEIATSMSYVHSVKIIHRDLKVENILLSNTLECKVMDFGISKMVQSTKTKFTKRIGTCSYIAPEVVLNSKYDNRVDVFSFGIMIFVVMTEEVFPYGDRNQKLIEITVAQNPDFRPKWVDHEKKLLIPSWVKRLAERCWSHSPSKRPLFDEIIQHLKGMEVQESSLVDGNADDKTVEEDKFVSSVEETEPIDDGEVEKEEYQRMITELQLEVVALRNKINEMTGNM